MKEASILIVILLLCIIALQNYVGEGKSWCWLAVYFVLNLLYSLKLKNVALLDVVILVSGFLIRLLYGSAVTGISISFWMCMTVIAASFYLGFGKRRNELLKNEEDVEKIRKVLKYYNKEFLDKNMYMCLALMNVFYALWSMDKSTMLTNGNKYLVFTVPIVLVITLKYSMDIENVYEACQSSDGDPVEVLLHDKMLLGLCVVYIVVMFAALYL